MEERVRQTLESAVLWFEPDADGVEPVVEAIGDAQVVLLGESTHGTHEFYRVRAEITKALIERAGFNVIALEADWPDAQRVNRYVRHASGDASAVASLCEFTRFPRWMWRNTVTVGLVEWLRGYNARLSSERQVSVYGLDLYSLRAAMAAVLNYIQEVDPLAVARARERYACFDSYGNDAREYGQGWGARLGISCEQEAVDQLVELRRHAHRYASDADEFFLAEQSATMVRRAEEFYRTLFGSRMNLWNLRSRHLADTLEAVLDQAQRSHGRARAVVWAHNAHVGDARATDMAGWGEISMGQLVRERLGADVRLVGLTTHAGTVTAAPDWDGAASLVCLPPAHEESYERIFHDMAVDRFILPLADPRVRDVLSEPRIERAVGAVYRGNSDPSIPYFSARLADQFDAVIHIDATRGVEPLERWARSEADLPATYPSGL